VPIAEHLAAQLLSGPPARDPEAVAERLLAVQAQDPRGARLAIRARTTGLRAADVDSKLDDGSLVVGWLNRGTLHLVRRDDYPWLHSLTTPPIFTANARRLSQEGVSPRHQELAVATIDRALADEGPLTRRELRGRVSQAGVRTEGQALVHLLLLACLRGIAVRGPMRGGEQGYVRVEDWLGSPSAVDRDQALAELARRYLAGHAPASERDLARWSGLPLRDVRAGLRSIGSELSTRADGLVELAEHPAEAVPLPAPRLLGQFDPLLLGWASRDEILDGHTKIVTTNGLFRPFALVEGKAVAIWSRRAGKIDIQPFGRLAREIRVALETDAEDVTRFFS
jgi:hypothetical protein